MKNLLGNFFSGMGGDPIAKGLEFAAESIFSAFSGFGKAKMGLEELAQVYSEPLDNLILKAMKSGLKYAGGSFNVKYLSDTTFETSYELYFQNEKKEWIKKEAKSKPQPIDYLNEDAEKELKEKEKVSFEIDPPKEPSKNKETQNVPL